MKIINFKRFGIFVVGIALMVMLFINIIATNVDSKTEIRYIDFTISENDTLWSISKIIKTNNINYEKKDLREIIYELENINGLDNSSIYVNQIIQIPEI